MKYFTPTQDRVLGIFAAKLHLFREINKKTVIFHAYIEKEALQIREKNIHLPILR